MRIMRARRLSHGSRLLAAGRPRCTLGWRLCSTSAVPPSPTDGAAEQQRQLAEPFDLALRAKVLGVPLTPAELAAMQALADEQYGDGDGVLTRGEFMSLVRERHGVEEERGALIDFISRSDALTRTNQVVTWLDYMATGLFAALGTIVAGNAGMNVVGTTVVACAASLGGGTLNNVLTNNMRGGVFWVRKPEFLATSLAVSIAVFYCWPMHEDASANAVLSRLERAGCEFGEAITEERFEAALRADPCTARRVLSDFVRHMYPHAIPGHADGTPLHSGHQHVRMGDAEATRRLFGWLETHCGAGECTHGPELDLTALRLLIRWETLDSEALYALETVALGAVAVIGAQQGIHSGAPPLACVALAVTVCAGGVLRDLLCHRPVAIGAQSYAFATAAGASVYVGLRQLAVHGYPIPLMLRVVLGAGTTVSQRAYVWWFASDHGLGDHALAPMALDARESHSGVKLERKPR